MRELRRLVLPLRRAVFRGSAEYWERRYREGHDSGAGSYGQIAQFKARTLNEFVVRHQVRSVVELGCGDGNQLSLARYPEYVGLDVSRTAIARCREAFADDPTKRFEVLDDGMPVPRAELALSLDVMYHLVEDRVFRHHLRDLFGAATRYVAIFGVDADEPTTVPHVRHRKFTPWVLANEPTWQQIATVSNPYRGADSIADFHFFERQCDQRRRP